MFATLFVFILSSASHAGLTHYVQTFPPLQLLMQQDIKISFYHDCFDADLAFLYPHHVRPYHEHNQSSFHLNSCIGSILNQWSFGQRSDVSTHKQGYSCRKW
jgi:hypothetical protein